MSKFFVLNLILTISLNVLAQEVMIPSHEATLDEFVEAVKNNRLSRPIRISPDFFPVTDTADFQYVLMSSLEGSTEATALRETVARNLPGNVKLVVLTSTSEAKRTQEKYSKWIPKERLIVAIDNSSSTSYGFWARDSFPVPVINRRTGQTDLIAAKYFRPFASWKAIADSVGSTYKKMSFTFVGGNLLADEDGSCFSVNSSRLFNLKAKDLETSYGCKKVHLMQYLAGIGDVDEVLKPLPGKKMLTNQSSYVNYLKGIGYDVILLPDAPGSYGTYTNSLVVGQTVFMPVYGASSDNVAADVYEQLGYTVIPIKSNYLSNSLLGSVHCMTMAYPTVKLTRLLELLDARAYTN